MRVLLLAYHFPPIGGAGTQRSAKLARYLPEEGVELTVVTGPGSAEYRWTPHDSSLGDDVHESVVVHRLPGPEPGRPVGLRSTAQRWSRWKSAWERWWELEAVRVGVEAGRDADVVYASLNPFQTAGAAVRVARELGKPLVVDLEDPWALDEMLPHETGVHERLELRTMRRALAAADAVVMNTPEAAARVRTAFPELRAKPVTAIMNGYDAADFAGVPSGHPAGRFRIVHTGSLHQWAARRSFLRRWLGGADLDVDPLTRSLVPLLTAIERLLGERPELRGELELHLAGRVTAEDRATYAAAVVPVREHGFLSHRESVALMRSADLLFLPMHDLPPGRRAGIVPCKTYEYLGSGRPILAAVPDGDARELLAEAGNAYICRPADVDALARAVAAAIDDSAGDAPPEPDGAVLARVERRTLTRDLLTFLRSLDVATADDRPAPVPARVA